MILETRKLLSLLLIPLILIIIYLLVALNISTVFEYPFILLLLNTVFLGIIPFIIAYLSYKVVTRSGSVSVFLMGCGIFIFGLGSIAAGWVNALPNGPNMTVTIHNTCALIGSIFIFAAALLSSHRARLSSETSKGTMIIAVYSLIVVFVVLFGFATLQGLIPPFFVPVYGPTLLRQIILENAILLFTLSSILFMVTYYKERTDFFFWYSVAFAMVAIGLLAVFFQPSVGSLIGWVGRFSQYLGFVFALNAVLIARKISTHKGLPLDKVIADFFVDAELSYKTLVETATDAIITFDDHNRILLWNSAAERMFGYTKPEAIGSSFEELVVSEKYKTDLKKALINSTLTNNNSNTSLTIEIDAKRRDKTFFPVEITISRREQDASQIITCIVRDLTERRRVEDALRDSEERYRTVAEFTFDWEFWIDPEGRFKYISPSAERILGRSVDKSVSAEELFRMIVHPDDLKTRISHLEQEKSGQKSFELEFRIVRPDGEVRWIHHVCQPIWNKEGKFFGTRGSNRDITDRKRIEEAMIESEKKYRLIFETSNEGIWITDADRKTVLVNQRMADMLGYSLDEMLGKTPSEFLVAGQEQIRQKIRDDLLKGIPTHNEFQFRRKDGSDLWVISSAAPVFDHDGRYLRTVSMLADITGRKKAEIALHEMQMRTTAILEGITDTFYALDNQWRFITVNPAAEKAPFGRPAAELLGRVIWELYPGLIGTRIHQHYLDAAEKHSLEHYEAKSPLNGRWYEVFMQGQKAGVDVYMRDITGRKQLEENLQNTLQRFYQILSEMPYGILLVTDTNQVEFVNQTFCDIFGLNDSPADLVNLTADEMIYKIRFAFRDPEAALARIREIVHLGQLVRSEDVFIGTDRVFQRDFIPVTIGNNRVGRLWIHSEITEPRKTEEALRMSEERLRLAQEGSGAGIWDWNIRSGEIIWDLNMFKIFGLDPKKDHASLELWNQIMHSEDAKMANARLAQSLKDHTELSNEYRIILPTGEVRWISAMGKGIYDESGAPVRMSGICIDITDRRAAEHALMESEKRFRLALRNAPVAVAIQDTDLVFRWAYNQRTIKPEEVIGKKDTDIFTPEDAEHLIELKRTCLTTGKDVRKKIWLTMNGKRLFFDLYLEPLRNNYGQITGIGIATVDLTEQKHIEDALRYSEQNLLQAQELLEAVTKGTDVIIAVQDMNFRYIFFNQTYKEEIKRLTGKELTIGTSMIELFAGVPEEQRRSINEWSRVLNGENINQIISFGERGENMRVYHVLHTPIRDSSGTIIAAGEVAYNVTRQEQVENALRETKEYLDNLITYANAPIIVWDPHFHITLFNHAFEHLTGRKAKEVIGKPLEILLPEKYLIKAMDLIKKTGEGERWESVEIPILHKNGEIRIVLWNSAAIFGSDGKTIVSTIAQGQDITDRKKIESEYRLKASEYAKMNVELQREILQRKSADDNLKKTLSLLNASLESTTDGILVVDQEGIVTSHNQNFVTMWNIPPEIIKTLDNKKIITYFLSLIKDPDGFLINMNDLLIHPSRESYDMIELNDGRIFERYSKPQKIGKDVVGRVWSFRDITDRKRSEEKLVSSLQEKEVLLREIHHRVKNNLQLITGLLDMTRMRTKDETTTAILTDMMLKIQTMAQIHTRLYESKQFGKIGLTSQVRDQVAALSNIYSHKGHEISCEIHADEIFLPVDQALPCALVLNELLSNSYKHAFKGKKHGKIDVFAVQENDHIRITVKDDGIGMPPDFDIDHTSSLGMKLIRTLIRHQLKGSLYINSYHGTEMIVEFPFM
jgi:PAS domain S-box-containing protein